MDPIQNIKLRWLNGTLGDVRYHVTQLQFWQQAPQKWQPAINAYRCETAVRICVDLAGVARADLQLTVEPQRVIVRGIRLSPEPLPQHGRALQILALEIDYGPFEREIKFSARIDVERAEAHHEAGLLWIVLPLA